LSGRPISRPDNESLAPVTENLAPQREGGPTTWPSCRSTRSVR